MKLFIASTPKIAFRIAETLGYKSTVNREYIVCGREGFVTWCGALSCELCPPQDYRPDLARWSLSDLPILPVQWKKRLVPIAGAQEQLNVIRALARRVERVVHAGFPDYEGQMAVDDVVELLGVQRPVDRLWLTSLEVESIRAALESMSSNDDYRALGRYAAVKAKANWLVGMNMTRAMTCLGRYSGYPNIISIGRDHSPVLSMIVDREHQARNSRPVHHCRPRIRLRAGRFERWADLVLDPSVLDQAMDEQGRLTAEGMVEEALRRLLGQGGEVHSYRRDECLVPPPKPFTLQELQRAAFDRYGLTAKTTLDLALGLYEDGAITYPKTQNDHFPLAFHAQAGTTLAKLKNRFPLAQKANSRVVSLAWSSDLEPLVHAIMPTGSLPDNLSGDRGKVFSLIVENYIQQFFPDHCYEQQRIVFRLGTFSNNENQTCPPHVADNEKSLYWVIENRKLKSGGWKSTIPGIIEKEYPVADPIESFELKAGEFVSCVATELNSLADEGIKPFTEATLIDALGAVHPDLVMTGSTVLDELKKLGYIESGRSLVVTSAGERVFGFIPDELKNLDLAAAWAERMRGAAAPEIAVQLLDEEAKTVERMIQEVTSHGAEPPNYQGHHACPLCGASLRVFVWKNVKSLFWACSKSFYTHGKFMDQQGRPGELIELPAVEARAEVREEGIPCPHPGCQGRTRRLGVPYHPGFYYWRCSSHGTPKGHGAYTDHNHAPGREIPARSAVL